MSTKQLSKAGFGTPRELFGIVARAPRVDASTRRVHRSTSAGNWVPDDYDFRLPSQLVADRLSGEQRLMLAVLEDAVRIAMKATAGRIERAEVDAWFAADDRGWLYSYASVCDALGLDPAWARRRLAERMAAGTISRRRPRVVAGVRTSQTRGVRRRGAR